MRTFLKIGLCLLLAAGFFACEKDETHTTGRVKVSCKSSDGLKSFIIYTDVEPPKNIIYTKENPQDNFSVDFNPGNYIYTFVKSSGTSSGLEMFQIRAGRTTKISYNNGSPTIDYE